MIQISYWLFTRIFTFLKVCINPVATYTVNFKLCQLVPSLITNNDFKEFQIS